VESLIECLSLIPAPAWSAIVTAILTSSVAYIGISYTNKENTKRMHSQHEHERQLRRDEVTREKAEELYVSVKKFCNAMVSDHFAYVRVMKGEFSYNDALDLTLSSAETNGYDAQRIHMIVDIYFSNISKDLADLVEFNGTVLDIRENFKHEYNNGMQVNNEMAKVYSTKIQSLSSEALKFENTVLSTIKNA
jgi:hypothetical protein